MKCLECDKDFSQERGLHIHLRSHSMTQSDYYTKHFPLLCLDGEPVKFKSKEQYFSAKFNSLGARNRWLRDEANREAAKTYLIDLLKERAQDKHSLLAPCQVELQTRNLPSVEWYVQYFGSYSTACEIAGVIPKFVTDKIPQTTQPNNPLILIDTREKKPLAFPNSISQGLNFGDYTCGGEDYSRVFVERKAGGDFTTTMSSNYDRFKNEIERCVQMDCFMFVVVEDSIEKLVKYNGKFGAPKAKLDLVFYRMRELINLYPNNFQVLFTGGRQKSKDIIPLLLTNYDLRKYDVQFLFDSGVFE